MGENIGKIFLKIMALMYVLAVLYITFLAPYRYTGRFTADNVNFSPFSDKWFYISNFTTLRDNQKLFIVKEMGGNFLLLMPFSWFVFALFKNKIKRVLMALLLAIIAICIESLQYGLHIGTFDIDDIILNITGGFFGIFLFDVVCNKKG